MIAGLNTSASKMPKAKTAKVKRQKKSRNEYAKKEIQSGNRSPKFEEWWWSPM
jgi:hypothetical protein